MQKIGEGILTVLKLSINPFKFIGTKCKKIHFAFKGFFDLIENHQIELNYSPNERVTGFTNLLIACLCILSFIVLIFSKTRGSHNLINKIWMMCFDITLSIGATLGFIVHGLKIPGGIIGGLWYCLYVFLLVALMFRFFQAFWDCNKKTCLWMTPFLIILAYIHLIACWKYDTFLYIGSYAILFGFIMGITQLVFIFTRNSGYVLHLIADFVALGAFIFEATNFRFEDWDQNGFFHLGICLYVLMSTFAFVASLPPIVDRKERELELKEIKGIEDSFEYQKLPESVDTVN
ncbi:hypothetical protein ENUP19_0266G0018 [Entamoeba nuttalli]|uniref:Uncharacterized protein n=2 Tax=Entamoeba nuttalli TaxID=412467 RepID=K2GUT8_ENTNP|nr:hypothetical protein ENU1_192460 [Entamoeba nuttalli P19]EKE37597.1 hypothetical protein ENU1_192460 [Entamoeba nuttalli P19]|eukprot:XP_008860075.1 hypothetical protein ENU1_192460 [Entamoeba nuttalli P19]